MLRLFTLVSTTRVDFVENGTNMEQITRVLMLKANHKPNHSLITFLCLLTHTQHTVHVTNRQSIFSGIFHHATYQESIKHRDENDLDWNESAFMTGS